MFYFITYIFFKVFNTLLVSKKYFNVFNLFIFNKDIFIYDKDANVVTVVPLEVRVYNQVRN